MAVLFGLGVSVALVRCSGYWLEVFVFFVRLCCFVGTFCVEVVSSVLFVLLYFLLLCLVLLMLAVLLVILFMFCEVFYETSCFVV